MRVGVSITKQLQWHGHNEQFSNVYHYDFGAGGGILPGAMSALADALVAQEKLVHSASVSFIGSRVWSHGGTPAENETLLLRDETGNGSLTISAGLYREACVVVQLYTGRHTATGRRIYLRKFIHSCGLPATATNAEYGQVALTSNGKAPFLQYGQNIRTLNLLASAEVAVLEAPGGSNLAGDASVSVLDYVTMHQFRN